MGLPRAKGAVIIPSIMYPYKKTQPQKFYPAVKKPQEKRVSLNDLTALLAAWDPKLTECSEMNLIACGNTAMALLGHKTLTKELEFLVPDKKEYGQLVLFLKAEKYVKAAGAGWQRAHQPFLFNLYSGNRVYSLELLESPLQNSGNQKIQQWKKIYLGALNPLDLIISKLFRATEADLQDCRTLLKHENINILQLKKRCKDTAAYDVREAQVMRALDRLLEKSTKA